MSPQPTASIRPREAARLLGISENTLWRWIKGKRGLSTLLTRPAQMSTTCRSKPKPTRQLWPLPVSIVAVRWLMRVMMPTCVVR